MREMAYFRLSTRVIVIKTRVLRQCMGGQLWTNGPFAQLLRVYVVSYLLLSLFWL